MLKPINNSVSCSQPVSQGLLVAWFDGSYVAHIACAERCGGEFFGSTASLHLYSNH
jgi:hypothetical protein